MKVFPAVWRRFRAFLRFDGGERHHGMLVNPEPRTVLRRGAKLVLIRGTESQDQFINHYVRR